MSSRGTSAEAVADRIHQARRNASVTVEQLAEKSGIPYPTLRRRLGSRPGLFTIDDLNWIAQALSVTPEWLASGLEVAA